MLIGKVWPDSGAPKVFVAEDGRKLTVEVHEFGLLVSDEGGASALPHVEETADPGIFFVSGVPVARFEKTADPDVFLVAGVLFRRIPG